MNSTTSRLLSIYGLIALVALVYLPSSAALARLWFDYGNLGYTHGPLVLGITLWLVFRDRKRLAGPPLKPSVPGFALLLAASLLWGVFYQGGVLGVHLALLPLLIWLAAYAALGWPLARQLIFPIGFLYFGLTIFDRLTGILQGLTVHAVGFLLSVVDVPLEIQGAYVSIPAGTFEIQTGCSGQHYFVVGLALAALWGELCRETWQRRILLVVVMSVLALLTNWVRVFTVIMAGHFSHMKHWLIHEHYYFGWAIFAVAVVIFLLIARKLAPAGPDPAPASSAQADSSWVPVPVLSATAFALLIVPVTLHLFAPVRQTFVAVGGGLGQWVRGSILPLQQPVLVPVNPEDVVAAQKMILKGVTSLRDGAFAEAESQLLEARRLAAGHMEISHEAVLLAALVESQLAQQKVADARASLQELERVAPETRIALLLDGRVSLAEKDTVNGIAQLQRLVLAEPDYLQARLVLGRALLARSSIMQAESQFREALRIAPGNQAAKAMMAQARMLQVDPATITNPLVLNNLAWLYHSRGDERAEETARRAHQLAPDEPAVVDTYGWILLARGKRSEALPLLEKAARTAPDVAEISYHYGVALAQEGRKEEAMNVLRRLVAADVTFPQREEAEKLLAKLQG